MTVLLTTRPNTRVPLWRPLATVSMALLVIMGIIVALIFAEALFYSWRRNWPACWIDQRASPMGIRRIHRRYCPDLSVLEGLQTPSLQHPTKLTNGLERLLEIHAAGELTEEVRTSNRYQCKVDADLKVGVSVYFWNDPGTEDRVTAHLDQKLLDKEQVDSVIDGVRRLGRGTP